MWLRNMSHGQRWMYILVTLCGCASRPMTEGSIPKQEDLIETAKPIEVKSASLPDAKTTEPSSIQVPTNCTPENGYCLPPSEFVRKLCGRYYPSLSLALLQKGLPFTHGYLNRNVEAWNASGGMSSNDKLIFDEEVLVLAKRIADQGGMVMSGAQGGYDVLRWDGTCATLTEEELTLKRPPKPKFAKVTWKELNDETKNTLLKNPKIADLVALRKKECKGATFGEVSMECVKADDKLSATIVFVVRNEGGIPLPSSL